MTETQLSRPVEDITPAAVPAPEPVRTGLLLLAGDPDDGSEPHICRGID